MTDPLPALGARLERLRRAKGLTVASLADRAGLDRVQVEALLAGKVDPGISTVLSLATALDIEPGNLIEGVTWIPAEDGTGEYRVED